MIKFLGILCLVWLFVEGAEPIQVIKRFFDVAAESEPKNIFLKIIQNLVNCALCSGFWIGLIFYQDLTLACLVSISSEIFYRLLLALFHRWLP